MKTPNIHIHLETAREPRLLDFAKADYLDRFPTQHQLLCPNEFCDSVARNIDLDALIQEQAEDFLLNPVDAPHVFEHLCTGRVAIPIQDRQPGDPSHSTCNSVWRVTLVKAEDDEIDK